MTFTFSPFRFERIFFSLSFPPFYTVLRNSLYCVASCSCPRGYTGVYCEEDIDYCVGHRCSEHGVCVDRRHNFTCICTLGFEGPLCELETDDCGSFPCASGATCVDLISDYRCQCPPGFEGMRPSDAIVSLFTAISMVISRNIRIEGNLQNLKCRDPKNRK